MEAGKVNEAEEVLDMVLPVITFEEFTAERPFWERIADRTHCSVLPPHAQRQTGWM